MFASHIHSKSLAVVCRSLATMLHSGVALTKSFELAAARYGDRRCRQALLGVCDGIARGDQIAEAMRAQGNAFPALVIDMVEVAEQTGSLPEILSALAEHYENNVRMRRNFLMSIAWPAFQLTAAVFIIALLILLLGWVSQVTGNEAIDVLGLGLIGPSGAIIWLTLTFGSVFLLFLGYQVLTRGFQGKRFLDPLLMQVPVLGQCLRSFAIARFSWAFYLTQQTGMPIGRSLSLSLRATANGAFIEATPRIINLVKSGEMLGDALEAARLFPEDYMHMVRVAETSGTVPEALHRLSPQFEEQARRSLTALTATLAWVIWAVVAAFIIFFIFRLASFYVNMLSGAAHGL